MLSKVAVVLSERVAMFEFGVICEVFGLDRTADGLPAFDFKVCGADPGKAAAVHLTRQHGHPGIRAGRTRAGRSGRDSRLLGIVLGQFRRARRRRVRAASDAGAIVLTVCSGAFLAGAAGLLDGRTCTTHWRYVDQLAAPISRGDLTRTCCSSTRAT